MFLYVDDEKSVIHLEIYKKNLNKLCLHGVGEKNLTQIKVVWFEDFLLHFEPKSKSFEEFVCLSLDILQRDGGIAQIQTFWGT